MNITYEVESTGHLLVTVENMKITSAEKVNENTNLEALAQAMVSDALETLKKHHNIVPMWAKKETIDSRSHKRLVTYSGTSDAFSNDDAHYALAATSREPYFDENGDMVVVYLENLIDIAKQHGFISKESNVNSLSVIEGEFINNHEEDLARLFFLDYCKKNNIILLEQEIFEEIEELDPDKILNEEDLINYYLMEKQDFKNEYWADQMHKELYLKCIENDWDYLSAEEYVKCYDLLHTDIGFDDYNSIIRTLNFHGYNSITDADPVKNNIAWQLIEEYFEIKEGQTNA